MTWTVTTQTFTRKGWDAKKRAFTTRRWTGTVAHRHTDRTWEGAHYKDADKAWAFMQAANKGGE